MNDGFYSHHPGHRGHSQPSARSGPQKDGPYWQQDAGESDHAVNAKQTLISKQDTKTTRLGQLAQWHFPLPLDWAEDSYGSPRNSSLSRLTLAIGIVVNEQKICSICEDFL